MRDCPLCEELRIEEEARTEGDSLNRLLRLYRFFLKGALHVTDCCAPAAAGLLNASVPAVQFGQNVLGAMVQTRPRDQRPLLLLQFFGPNWHVGRQLGDVLSVGKAATPCSVDGQRDGPVRMNLEKKREPDGGVNPTFGKLEGRRFSGPIFIHVFGEVSPPERHRQSADSFPFQSQNPGED